MAGSVELQGSDDDLCRLLLGKGLASRDKLESLVRERRMLASGGAVLPPLLQALSAQGLVASGAIDRLRAQTQAFATCEGCRTFHTIFFHLPGSAHKCSKCSLPLRARAVAAPTTSTPEAEESLAGASLLGGDETLLDMPTQKKPAAVVKPPAEAAKLDVGLTPPPMRKDEPKPATPAAAKAKDDETKVIGLSQAQEPESVVGLPKGRDETSLLNLSDRVPKGPASPQESLMGVLPDAGETMLGMGDVAKKTPAPPPSAKPPVKMPALPRDPHDTAATIVIGSQSETKLDPTLIMGATSESKIEPTLMMPAADGTKIDPTLIAGITPRTKSDTVNRTDPRGLDVTPRTASGGQRSFTPTKAAPKDVQDAAKDPARIFGKYVLVKELGRGGAGVVYLAWDTTLAQYVALKFIRDQEVEDGSSSTGSSQAVADFQKEARMSAKLRHPNIIRIYELGCMSNRYYLSMDYIEGGSLFEVIHDGKERNTDSVFHKDPKKYLAMFRLICEAVDSAHKHDPPVIHRDIKPHNVLVDKRGVPYVVDFGLAKEVEMSTSANTMTGVVKGTPSYMAPEQAEGRNKDVDARTDVYSLGAILYELLTGRPPFSGGSVREVLNAICTVLPDRPNEAITKALIEKPDGANRPRPVAKPLETICMKALEKALPDRYQSAKELADDVGRFLNDEDILAQEPSLYRRLRRAMRQHPLVTGAIAAVLLCGIAIGAVLKYAPKTDNTARLQLEAAAEEHLKASDWATMKGDAENLRRLDAKHPLAAKIEKALAAHAADQDARRRAWAAGIGRLAAGSLPAVLEELRKPFREAGDLKAEFADPLERTLFEIQAATENQARDLIGAGPREEWLDAKVKDAARACRDRLNHLLALASDADFSFKPSAQIAPLRTGLEPLLAYEGLWDLRVNVAPFARVILKRGDKVVAEEWTPVGLRGLEVKDGYKIELAWPTTAKPAKAVALDVKDLKHGAKLVLSGDMSKSDVRLEK